MPRVSYMPRAGANHPQAAQALEMRAPPPPPCPLPLPSPWWLIGGGGVSVGWGTGGGVCGWDLLKLPHPV